MTNPLSGQTFLANENQELQPTSLNYFYDIDSQYYNEQLTINVSNLPNGLSFNDGVIFGTPTVSGNYNIIVTATDLLNESTSFNFNLNISDINDLPVINLSPVNSYYNSGKEIRFEIDINDEEDGKLINADFLNLPYWLQLSNFDEGSYLLEELQLMMTQVYTKFQLTLSIATMKNQ